MGDHPDGGGKVTVRDGKYGPYVNYGKVNATLPKGKDPMSVTLDEAVALIAEKAAQGRRRQEAVPQGCSQAAAKKPAAKKPAAKKTAAKEKA